MSTERDDLPMPAAMRSGAGADLLAVGFGTTIASWTVAYFCRLITQMVASPAAIVALLIAAAGLVGACQVAAGWIVGRHTRRGTVGGALAGLITGSLNLLAAASAFGSHVPNRVQPSAAIWIPATVVLAVILGTFGAVIGSRRSSLRASATSLRSAEASAMVAGPAAWSGGLAAVAAVGTFVLLIIGGVVTGTDAGLAVVDWPNTETYNMFLYPLERMTGGILLEHAHRLFGSLVGLTTLVLAIHVQATDRRRGVQALGWIALAMVIVQGILGGLRVTGHFTLSARAEDTQPSVVLAVVHGVFGQMVFAALALLAATRSRAWTAPTPRAPSPHAGTDRAFGAMLIVLLVAQLVMGALVRHFTWALQVLRYEVSATPAQLAGVGRWALNVHIALAVLVALAALAVGVRAWGLYRTIPTIRRMGSSVLILVGVQFTLGVGAVIVTGNDAPDRRPPELDVFLTTAHQVVGAALLAWAVLLQAWQRRLVSPAEGSLT